MTEYVDAEKLKELIDEKWKELADKNVKVGGGKWDIEIYTYLSVLRLIDSIQQEQSEVDLEKEVVSICKTYGITEHLDAELGPLDIKNIAHHFYELGRNARNEETKQPEYGYITTKYIPGKKPRWKVGDILAYYINTSNEEGEDVLGKVVNIERDEDGEWLYTFENEDVWDEESLITEGTYGK